MTVRAADLRVGDRISFGHVTVTSVMVTESLVFVAFDNARVEVLAPEDRVHILGE